jgi:glucose/arabinose dehydrogenase
MMGAIAAAAGAAAAGAAAADTLTGSAAYGDWRSDAPGVVRKLTVADLPPPGDTPSKTAPSSIAPRPAGAELKTLPGFVVRPFFKVDGPRLMRTAPNGDVFLAETNAGKITVLRTKDGADAPAAVETFAAGLDQPFGIAFWPARNPKWVYIANTNAVVRFPYRAGDLKARGPAEVIIPKLTESRRGHSTRDVAFSDDGKRMYVSVGSGSNVAEEVARKSPDEVAAFAKDHALGADWGAELGRADVLVASPDGTGLKVFATGIRNCVGLAVQPGDGTVWCTNNERDLLGDDLPPDYVTRVKEGGFYGWPWYYIGAHPDPRPNVKDQRPDLAEAVTVPDVLLQPHSAPLQMTFYTASKGKALFPANAREGAYVALHGSWNRAFRTGYKVVRVVMKDGAPTGEYEDVLTGFVIDEKKVWGRPVGVTVAQDGALLVSDDGGGLVWRVSPKAATP